MYTAESLQNLYGPIAAPLEEARNEVGALWTDALRLARVSEARHVPQPGGKLLRPALCLLATGALGAAKLSRYARLAAAFEALHIASLAHDDVIDKAILRRGTSSLNALWDNHAAVLGGDYLVARAVEMLAEYDSCPVIANAIVSVRRMAEGELFFFGRDEQEVTRDDCLMLAERKTASLFAEACSAPAYLLDESKREPLHRFGVALGTAFQLVDDVLDITQPTGVLGKPACGDVAEGKPTLPIFFLRTALTAAQVQRLDELRSRDITEDDRAWVIAQAQRAGVAEQTVALAREYTQRAATELRALAPGPCRESMAGILEFILFRVS